MTPHELMTKIEKEGKYDYYLEITFSDGNRHNFHKVLEHSDDWIKVEDIFDKEPKDYFGNAIDRCDHFINFAQVRAIRILQDIKPLEIPKSSKRR